MKRIAVIGAGISGLAAAYLVSRRHVVTLFEAEARLGGHTHTIRIDAPEGRIALDTGFLVHNDQTYPNLVRLFQELNIRTEASDMSFSVTCPSTGLEYSSRGLAGFFAQPRNMVRLEHYQLLSDIMRFNREAPAVLTAPSAGHWTLGSYVERARFGSAFMSKYLVPMTPRSGRRPSSQSACSRCRRWFASCRTTGCWPWARIRRGASCAAGATPTSTP